MPPSEAPTVEDFPAHGVNAIASMGQRALGYLIDAVIVQLPFVLASVAALLAAPDPAEYVTPWWAVAVQAVVFITYQTVLLAWRGRTVGCAAVGIRIARYGDGGRPTFSQAAIRCLIPGIFGANSLTALIEPLIPLTALLDQSGLRRAWHDKAAGTVVVRTR